MTAPLPLLRTGVLYIFLHIVVNNNFLSYFINIFSLLSVVLRLWFFSRVFLTLIFLVYIIYKFISKLIHNTREHRRRQHAPSENICLLKMCKKTYTRRRIHSIRVHTEKWKFGEQWLGKCNVVCEYFPFFVFGYCAVKRACCYVHCI